LNVQVGGAIDEAHAFVFETGRNAGGQRVGCAVALLGYRFLLSLDGSRMYGMEDLGKQSLFRPLYLRWVHAATKAEYVLGFTWYPPIGDGITMNVNP
jgi:hypothetical protein